MADVIIMPKLGFNMDEGKLVEWYKQVGDEIKKGEPLFSVETDKTNMDIEATGDGVVRALLINAGDKIPVTLPIAIVAGKDENIDDVLAAAQKELAGCSITDFKNCKEKCKDYDAILIGLTRNRQEPYDRINLRVDIMVEEGLFREVEELLEMGLAEEDISMKGIGYKEVIGFFDGLYDKDTAIDLIKKNSRHLAKRQLTWFRRYEDMKWFDISEYSGDEDAIEDIITWLRKR